MNDRGTPTLLVLAAATAVAVGACASTDESVPERGSDDAPDYQSTRDDAANSSDSSSSPSTSRAAAPQTRQSATGESGSGGGSAEPPKAVGPVAEVDGEAIPAEAFNEEIQKVAKTGKFPPSLLNKFKTRLIDRLVDQHLVDRAIEREEIEVSEKEVDGKLEKVRARFERAAKKKGKEQSLEQVASQYGISDSELRDSVRRSIAIEKLLVGEGMERPTDNEVEQYYEENKKKFTRPKQVRTRHILAKVKPDAAEAKWNDAKDRIKKIREKATADGTEFSDLAKETSDGPSAKNGGDIGYISRNQFDSSFTKVAFKLEKGEISEPVRTKYGWHIIKTLDKRKSKTLPFEEVEGQLEEQLKNKRIQKRLQKHLDDLRSGATIEKHPENVE